MANGVFQADASVEVYSYIYIYVHEFMGLGLFICLANVHVFQSEGMIEDRCIYMHIDIIFIIYICFIILCVYLHILFGQRFR